MRKKAEPPRETELEILPDDHSKDSPELYEQQKKARLELARLVAFFLDDFFTLGNTKFKFGLDPLLGLVPGLGDLSGALASALMLITAASQGIPKIVQLRMALNVLINTMFGMLPIVGDAFSFYYKSNRRNYQLLLKHAEQSRTSTKGDWIWVGALLTVLFAAISAALYTSLSLIIWLVQQVASIFA